MSGEIFKIEFMKEIDFFGQLVTRMSPWGPKFDFEVKHTK